MTKRCISAGLSLPLDMIERIDASRGDVPRSKFLLRILEQVYPAEEENKEHTEVAVAK
jgi:hypothetical protein